MSTAMKTEGRTGAQNGVGFSTPPPSSRPVRSEQWIGRAFYASPCRFFIDVPLDMTGCIAAAVREAQAKGIHVIEGGDVFATDALYRGAVLIEVEYDLAGLPEDGTIVRMRDVELLARSLPEKGVRLRAELDELVRWSLDLGHEVSAIYVRYAPTPAGVRPTEVFVALKPEAKSEAKSEAKPKTKSEASTTS